jgi:hexosaminidase
MAVGFSSLCVGRPEVSRFVATVFGEVAALTPGPFVHLGGDESHATVPADYDAFVADTIEVIRSLGKVPVGWEEVGRVGPGQGLVVQHWLDAGTAVRGAEAGAGVVLSPSSRLYFDMAYGPFAPDGNSWAGTIDTRRVYDWDPATALDGAGGSEVPADAVLGVEAPLWTELVETPDDLFRRLLPRLPALAEVAWSLQSARSWEDFVARVGPHGRWWSAAGLAFTADPSVPIEVGP